MSFAESGSNGPPGYRLKALDARTGIPISTFGKNGAVDLKLEADQEIDLDTGEMGLNATPLVVGDVIVVGVAHWPGSAPRTLRNAKGSVRGYVRTGKRLWIFHTIPRAGQFGYDTWLENSAEIPRTTSSTSTRTRTCISTGSCRPIPGSRTCRMSPVERRRCRCGGDAEQADRLADVVSDRRQAVHRLAVSGNDGAELLAYALP